MDFFNLYIILFRFAHLPSTISHIKHSALRKQEKRIKNENRMAFPHLTIPYFYTTFFAMLLIYVFCSL